MTQNLLYPTSEVRIELPSAIQRYLRDYFDRGLAQLRIRKPNDTYGAFDLKSGEECDYLHSLASFWFADALWVSQNGHLTRYDCATGTATHTWEPPDFASILAINGLTAFKYSSNFLPGFALDDQRLLWFLRGHYDRPSYFDPENTDYVALPVVFNLANPDQPWQPLMPQRANSFIRGTHPKTLYKTSNPNRYILAGEIDAGAECHVDDFIMVELRYALDLENHTYVYIDRQEKLEIADADTYYLQLHEYSYRSDRKFYIRWDDRPAESLMVGEVNLSGSISSEQLPDAAWLSELPQLALSYNSYHPDLFKHCHGFLSAIHNGNALVTSLLSGSHLILSYWNLDDYWAISRPVRSLATLRQDIQSSNYSRQRIALAEAMEQGEQGVAMVIQELQQGTKLQLLARDLLQKSHLPTAQQALQEWNPYQDFHCVQTLGTQMPDPLTNGVNFVWVSPNGQRLVIQRGSYTIETWDLQTGQVDRPIVYEGRGNEISTIAVHPDGQLCACGDYRGTIKLWNLQTGKLIRTIHANLAGHLSPGVKDWLTRRSWLMYWRFIGAVNALAISADGELLISGYEVGNVKVWRLQFAELLRHFRCSLLNSLSGLTKVAISTDRSTLVAGYGQFSGSGPIVVWDLPTSKRLCCFQVDPHAIQCMALSADGQVLITGGRELSAWDLATGQRLNQHSPDFDARFIKAVAFSPDDQFFLSVSSDALHPTIKLWKVKGLTNIQEFASGHTQQVRTLAFSPDGRFFVSGSDDGTMNIWRVSTEE